MTHEFSNQVWFSRGRRGHVMLLAAMLGIAAIVSGCEHFLGPEARIERAQTAYETGDYVAAMSDVKVALEEAPDNSAGRVLLARISLKLGDVAGARKDLDRALAAGADPASVRDLNYQVLRAERRFEDMLITASADEGLSELDRAVYAATALTSLGRHEQAERTIESALTVAPDDPRVLIERSRLLSAKGMAPQAAEVLDDVVKQHPDLAEAWMLRGRYAMSVGDEEKAREAFERARETARTQLDMPDQLLLAAGLVESNLGLNDLERAENELKAMAALAPEAVPTRYLRARLAYTRKEFPVAAAELQRALTQMPDHVPSRLLLGAALLEQGNLEQAGSELSRLVADHPENFEARKALAKVHMARNDPMAAQRVLADSPSTAQSTGELEELYSSLLLQSGQTSEAIDRLEKTAAADPANTRVRLDLAAAYLAQGQRDKALATLKPISAEAGGNRRRELLVMAETLGRPAPEAIKGLEALMAEYPNDAAYRRMAGEYFRMEGYLAKARSAGEAAVELDPANVDGRVGLAKALYLLRDMEAAERQLRQILELDPANEPAHVLLAEREVERGNRAAARELLERAVSLNPAVVLSRLRLAQLAFEDGDDERARSLLEQTLVVGQHKINTLNWVGEVLLRSQKYEDALIEFNKAAADGSAEGHYNAARALVALDRTDEAQQRLQAAIKLNPTWHVPVALLTTLEARGGKTDEALARVRALRTAGGSPIAADAIEGDVLRAAGRHKEAAEAYERAAAARPTSALAVRLYQVRQAAGIAKPEASLLSWLEARPDDRMVRAILAEYYQVAGDRKAAITQYELATSGGGDAVNPLVLNNLAWLYYQTGDERAEELARRAYENGRGAPEIADTYGWILVEKGQAEEGLKLIEEAVAKAPQHPEILYHRAAALARAGRSEEALTALRALLDSQANFPSRDAAQTLLATLNP